MVTLSAEIDTRAALLQSGPMVGYTEMREAMLWVQTTESARVQIFYWDEENPEQRFATEVVETRRETAHTAHLLADRVLPGRRYAYELEINDGVVARPYPLRFQTPPALRDATSTPTLRIALGSCYYNTDPTTDNMKRPYGGDYQVFTSIAARHPDIMLWLGDNMYTREQDWNTRTGFIYRYSRSRSLPELQPLLGATHHYAIWDDHDYGPNNSDRGQWNKSTALEMFQLFWANPSYGIPDAPGCTSKFRWLDAEFFLLDNRSHRTPNERLTGERTMLGEAQFEWLIDNLVTSGARFKFVCTGGQVLNPVERYETYANLFPGERSRLLRTIRAEGVRGVIFLNGDRHHSELSKMDRRGTYPLYELTVSPLAAGAHMVPDEPNPLRVEGTFVGVRNFATIDIEGSWRERAAVINTYNSDGDWLWKYTIKAEELR